MWVRLTCGGLDQLREANRNGRAEIRAHSGGPGGEDLMLLFFSSGTTGFPKMVEHNYFYPLGHIVTASYWQNLEPGDIHLSVADSGWAKTMWGKFLWAMDGRGDCVRLRFPRKIFAEGTPKADGRQQGLDLLRASYRLSILCP
jgi:hypothetical protein